MRTWVRVGPITGHARVAGPVHVRSFTSTRTIPWISVTRIVSRREDAYRTEDDAPNSLSTYRLRLVLDDDEEVVLLVQRWQNRLGRRLSN